MESIKHPLLPIAITATHNETVHRFPSTEYPGNFVFKVPFGNDDPDWVPTASERNTFKVLNMEGFISGIKKHGSFLRRWNVGDVKVAWWIDKDEASLMLGDDWKVEALTFSMALEAAMNKLANGLSFTLSLSIDGEEPVKSIQVIADGEYEALFLVKRGVMADEMADAANKYWDADWRLPQDKFPWSQRLKRALVHLNTFAPSLDVWEDYKAELSWHTFDPSGIPNPSELKGLLRPLGEDDEDPILSEDDSDFCLAYHIVQSVLSFDWTKAKQETLRQHSFWLTLEPSREYEAPQLTDQPLVGGNVPMRDEVDPLWGTREDGHDFSGEPDPIIANEGESPLCPQGDGDPVLTVVRLTMHESARPTFAFKGTEEDVRYFFSNLMDNNPRYRMQNEPGKPMCCACDPEGGFDGVMYYVSERSDADATEGTFFNVVAVIPHQIDQRTILRVPASSQEEANLAVAALIEKNDIESVSTWCQWKEESEFLTEDVQQLPTIKGQPTWEVREWVDDDEIDVDPNEDLNIHPMMDTQRSFVWGYVGSETSASFIPTAWIKMKEGHFWANYRGIVIATPTDGQKDSIEQISDMSPMEGDVFWSKEFGRAYKIIFSFTDPA